ncbi:UNVERIFIED_CONTAM: Retrovirus-related Pol polyprotein from transposon RE1 [Sesamum radiatum]|uniref:Retrovirus-related Pol polyprotein from transposon RE1 n=1 Tax=Sesamum radiatum TaxID=300843 RepID=A0AAW2TJ88_SESRA
MTQRIQAQKTAETVCPTQELDPCTSTQPQPPLRRSTRISNQPTWLQDYHCNQTTSDSSPPTITCFGSLHSCFVASLSNLQEPRSYKQASQSVDWKKAMQVELDALHQNDTWDITPLPKDKKAIGCRWVYKLKLKSDGTIDKHKARLVAKGYNQVEGIDYVDSFSSVAKAVTVRTLLAVTASKHWTLHHIDVNNAFLHGTLDEEIYMQPPDGYSVPEGHVCKLKRSLYGLKQASRQWNTEFTNKVETFGFLQSKHDHCLFTKTSPSGLLVLLVYVDDILIAGTSETCIQEVKIYLHNLFTIKDLGVAKYYLGLEIARSERGIVVTQSKYICNLLHDAGVFYAKSATTPLPAGIKFSTEAGRVLPNPESYRRLIGRILYLGFTRADIAHAAQQLSQFMQHPCQQHWDAALHLLRYLKGTPNKGLFFSAGTTTDLIAYCDADWASCIDTRRSLTGFCIFLGSALISWKTKKQATVSRSTAEAEYRSMGSTTCELIWIHGLLLDLQIPVQTPIPFFCDNQAALHITANPVFHERTNHLEISTATSC